MSSQTWVDRFQDPARYDGIDTDSPREYLTGDFFHTNAGLFNSRAYTRAVIPPLAPEADDSDLAMTEAYSPPAVCAPAANIDAVMHDDLGNSITYNAAALVHFTPPLNYQHPTRPSMRVSKPLRSSFRPQRAQAGHEQRLQWQNILDAQRDLQARSPSDFFRAVVEINTERNTPKKGVFITPKKNENHVTETRVTDNTASFTPPHRPVPPPTPPIRRQRDLLEPEQSLNFISSPFELKPSALLEAELLSKEAQIILEQSSPLRSEAVSEPEAVPPSTVLIPKGPDPTLFKQPSPVSKPSSRKEFLTLPGAYNFSSSTTVSLSSTRKRKMDDISSDEGNAPHQQITNTTSSEQVSVQEMPLRRLGNMFATICTQVPYLIQHVWARIFGTSRVEERMAVETSANRHKRRAVSPTTSSSPKSTPSRRSSRRSSASRSPSTLPSSPPAIVVQPPEPVKTETTTREDTPLRAEPAPEAPVNPLVRYNQLRAHAAVVAEKQIMRDGKTEKQIRREIEAEALERGIAISPNDPRRTHRLGRHLSRRPMTAELSAKIDAEREQRRDAQVERLVEMSRNIVRNRPPPRRPLRGMSMKEKLRQMEEAKAAAAAQKKADEEAEWAAQEQIEAELNARDAAEAEAKLQAELKASISINDPLIKPVSEPLAESIDKAMSIANPSREVATLLDGSSLSKYDLERVVSNGGRGTSSWLNDNAVNGWFKAIVERKKDEVGYKKTSSAAPPFAAMNSAWLDNVQKKGMKSISRWSKRMDVSGLKLLQAERIFFPINSGSHWTLLVVSPQDRQISFLDSLGGEGPRYIEHARDWLAMELGNAYNADDWSEVIGQSSRQGNMDDCGVFTCLNGLASAKGREFTEVNADRMPLARRMIAAVLLSGEVDL